jgi:hypothetical protein
MLLYLCFGRNKLLEPAGNMGRKRAAEEVVDAELSTSIKKPIPQNHQTLKYGHKYT